MTVFFFMIGNTTKQRWVFSLWNETTKDITWTCGSKQKRNVKTEKKQGKSSRICDRQDGGWAGKRRGFQLGWKERKKWDETGLGLRWAALVWILWKQESWKGWWSEVSGVLHFYLSIYLLTHYREVNTKRGGLYCLYPLLFWESCPVLSCLVYCSTYW